MNVTIPIPDDLAQRLGAAGVDLSRRALEGFALEEYKAGCITKPNCAGGWALRPAMNSTVS